MAFQLSSTNEVCEIQQADQFQPAKSQFECGYFGVLMARSMSEVGKPPILSVQQVIDQAEKWYAQYDGSNDASNMDGMSTEQEYSLLQTVGLHYQSTQGSVPVILNWIEVGYPVIIAIAETSVFDMELGRNPYPWNPAGNHIIVVTGKTGDGNFLVRDSANCTDLYDPNSLRPGPRKYDAQKLQFVSATAVVPPWLPRPSSAVPPTHAQVEAALMLQITQVSSYFAVQNDGSWSVKKSGIILGHGMLDFYRNAGMSPLFGLTLFGLPLANEQGPVNGKEGTTMQMFERAILCYDPKHLIDTPPGAGNVYAMHLESGPGESFLATKMTATTPLGDILTQVTQLKNQVDAFFMQLQKQSGGN